MPLESNFLFPDGSLVMWVVILSVATPVIVTLLVLVLVRLLWKRAESGTQLAQLLPLPGEPPPPSGPPVG